MRSPSRPAFIARVAALLAAACTTLACAQAPQMFKAGPGPDELWDVTMKMEVAGMPMAMPAQTTQVCKNHAAGSEKFAPQQENCTTTNVKTVGNKSSFSFACTGNEPMSGTGEFTSTATSYEGRMRMKAGKRGEEMEMSQAISGRKVGTCTDTSKQVIAQVDALGEQGRLQTCKAALLSLQPEEFVKDTGLCKSQRKQFCDKATAIAGASRTAAGFRANMPLSTSAETYAKGFAACGQSFEATRKAACGNGTSTRDWTFVGSGNCDDDVRTLGDANCRGRSYTSIDRAMAPLCNRYAMVSRGGLATGAGSAGAASGAAGAAPTAPRPAPAPTPTPAADPVQEGVNSLRKLLPF